MDTTPITLDAARLAKFLSPLEAAPPDKFDALERALWKACFHDRVAATRRRATRRKRRRGRRTLARAAAVYEALLGRTGAAGAYRCQLRLGDLARYRGRAAAAAARYEAAAAARPGACGDAENALGVLAQGAGHHLTAARRYARGAAAGSSAAARNLSAVLATNVAPAAALDVMRLAASGATTEAAAALGGLDLGRARVAEVAAVVAYFETPA